MIAIKTRKYFSSALAAVLLACGMAAALVQPAYGQAAPRRYEIKLRPGYGESALLGVAGEIKKRFAFSDNPVFQNVYTFASAFSRSDLAAYLNGQYEYLQDDQPLKLSLTANDPGFTTNPQNVDKQWALPKAGFITAWNKTTGSLTNVVAVIDTGVDETHEDLQNINFVPGYNILTDQAIVGRGNSDDNGHGTLITGILGASANNGKGITGANWVISVMPIKALDQDGSGNSSDIAEAVVWAVDHGANFINLSLGGRGFGHDTTLASAIAYAFGKNAVIAAAAGNDVSETGGDMDKNPVFPVCNDNDKNMVIGVAAVDQNDGKADFSNYGKNCTDVSAPGKRILSTINRDPATQAAAPDSYAYASGTSLAVPFVIAEAALIRSYNPGATNVQIRDRIMSSADNIDGLNLTQCGGGSCAGLLGTGRINAAKALASPITPSPISEGDVVQDQSTGTVYQISGGQKRRVSAFVLAQRFRGISLRSVSSDQLAQFPEGAYATPKETTLVKTPSSGTVYIILQGLKLPVTYQVFEQRQLDFRNVNIVTDTELNSWTLGNFYPPVEGTLLRTAKNRTVFWTVGGVLHPINYPFYVEKGLNIFPVIVVSDQDIAGFTKGEPYIR